MGSMRGGGGDVIAEPTGNAWVASLRVVATFGALATVSTLVRLLTSVAIPLGPLAFLVGVLVLRRRVPRTEQLWASLSLAVVASVVLVVELLVAPSYDQQWLLGYFVAAEVIMGMLLGLLVFAGAQIDAIVRHMLPPRV